MCWPELLPLEDDESQRSEGLAPVERIDRYAVWQEAVLASHIPDSSSLIQSPAVGVLPAPM